MYLANYKKSFDNKIPSYMQRGDHQSLSSSVARGEHVCRRNGVDNGRCRFCWGVTDGTASIGCQHPIGHYDIWWDNKAFNNLQEALK